MASSVSKGGSSRAAAFGAPGAAILGRDARLPQERRRLRQGHRLPAGGRAGAGRVRREKRTSSSSTPAPSSRPPARSRSTPCWHCPTPGRTGARLVVTGCLAERYGDELAAALPEADAVVGFAGEGSISEVVLRRPPKGGPRDLLELPRPAPGRAVGLREGGRGLRPDVRLLCHPILPGKAAVEDAGVDPGRGPQSRGRRSAGDRAGGPGPRLLRARRRLTRGADAAAALARRVGGRRAGPGAAPLPLSVTGPRSVGGGHPRPRDAGAVLRPVAPARLGAAAQEDAPVGERRAVPGHDRRHPAPGARRRLPVLVHRRVPRRDRGRPRGAARVPRGGRARLGRAVPVLARGGHAGGGRWTAPSTTTS